MNSSLVFLDGIFFQKGGLVSVHMDGQNHPIDSALDPFLGHVVIAHLHHFPPHTLDKSLPGGGSCLWGRQCPHGHREHSSWLHHQTASGVLSRGQGGWFVGDEFLRMDLMPGHYGRFILLDEDAFKDPPSDTSVDNLVREVGRMSEILESLKGVVR